MSNIAGKSYAINVVSPAKWRGLANRVLFWAVRSPVVGRFLKSRLNGLLTLSLIHYARWAIIRPRDWPQLGPDQPRETLTYAYELFCSNFNGSWNQYIDSFSMTIDAGLDFFWINNVGYPNAMPIKPFHEYIQRNQIATDYYWNATPMATSNDIKSAARVRDELRMLVQLGDSDIDTVRFAGLFHDMVGRLQNDLGRIEPGPIISLANLAVAERTRAQVATQ
jgi:hypothetical protein